MLLGPSRVHAALRLDDNGPSSRRGVSLCGFYMTPDPQVAALVEREDFVRLTSERPENEICPNCRREVENPRRRPGQQQER